MTEDGEFQVTGSTGTLNYKRRLCDALRASFPRHGRHNAFQCLDYELAVKEMMVDDGPAYKEMIEELRAIDQEYGEGIEPRFRDQPEKIYKAELERRYSAILHYESSAGRLRAPKKGGSVSVTEITLSNLHPVVLLPVIMGMIKSNQNCNAFSEGETGSGKTYFSADMCRMVDSDFWTDKIAYDYDMWNEIQSNMDAAREQTAGRAVLNEEMTLWANNEEHADPVNILLSKDYDSYRYKGQFIMGTGPKVKKVTLGVRSNFHIVFSMVGKKAPGVAQPSYARFNDKGELVKTFIKVPLSQVLRAYGADNIGGAEDIMVNVDTVKFPDPEFILTKEDEYGNPRKEQDWTRDLNGVFNPRDELLRAYELQRAEIIHKRQQDQKDERDTIWMRKEANKMKARREYQEELNKKNAVFESPEKEAILVRVKELKDEGLSLTETADKLELEGYKLPQTEEGRKSFVNRYKKKLKAVSPETAQT